MTRVAQIWRHPIKGIGAESLESVMLAANLPMPGDRAWAFGVGDTQDTGAWQRCSNFARGCHGPQLMAITAQSLDDGRIALDHPQAGPLTINPSQDTAKLTAWLTPLWPAARPALSRLIPAPAEGMSDADYACLSVLGTASLAALSQDCGKPLDPRRFRGNLWLDGLAPFDELDLIGRRLQIGTAVLEVVEPIDRCRATQVDPETGEEDTEVLRTLRKTRGHIDFGVKARVLEPGHVALNAEVGIL
ncbi:MOSC domain-containing protein [Pseudooceanicola algae]|uniref:Uncharacterized protein n=1 Tax=Pseudooceanicola algae TaxID=1537215 RepID=A0A418SKJ9_9RHOB|nr:MOSC domain-containing protein [Pseudooceanicola algae]QPM90753.1 hypothetical protein PSAL_019930 [Pseudooceanicola algae]